MSDATNVPDPGGFFTPEKAVDLGELLAADNRKVAVSSDGTDYSRMIKGLVVSGLLSKGADAVDLGDVSGPAAALAGRTFGCSVYVSSELPGVCRLFDGRGPFTQQKMRHLETISGDGQEKREIGILSRYETADREYIRHISGSGKQISGATVLLGCVQSPASLAAKKAFASAGIECVILDIENEGGVSDKEYGCLRKTVSHRDACIGAEMDRSGFSVTVINECGEEMDPSKAAAIALGYIKPAKTVLPEDCSKLIEDSVPDSEIIFSAPDLPSVAGCMADNNADAGVCSAGVLSGDLPVPDAVRTMEIMSEIANGANLKKTADGLPTYRRRVERIDIQCSDEEFSRCMKQETPGIKCKRMLHVSGWRIDMDEGWFLVSRPENGQVLVTAEAEDPAYMVGLMEAATDLVRRCSENQ